MDVSISTRANQLWGVNRKPDKIILSNYVLATEPKQRPKMT